MLNLRVVTSTLTTFAGLTFVICVAYGLVVPASLHMPTFLEHVLPGFVWLSPGAFVLGLVESALYGLYAGVVFVPLYNAFWRRARGPAA